jgi:hypothetical protein
MKSAQVEIMATRPAQGSQFDNKATALIHLSEQCPIVYWRIKKGKDKDKFALVKLP